MLSIWQMISGCDWGEIDKRNIPDDERLLVMQDRLIAEERENVAEAAEGIRILAKKEEEEDKRRNATQERKHVFPVRIGLDWQLVPQAYGQTRNAARDLSRPSPLLFTDNT